MCFKHPPNVHCAFDIVVLCQERTYGEAEWKQRNPLFERNVHQCPAGWSQFNQCNCPTVRQMPSWEYKHKHNYKYVIKRKGPRECVCFLMKWTTIWVWSGDEFFLSKLKTMLFWSKAPHPLIRGRCGQRLQISLYELNSKISFPSQIPLSRNVFCHSPIHSNWRTSLQMISFIVFQVKISRLQHLIQWLCKLHSVQQYIQLTCCQGNTLWALWAIVATRLDTR